MKETYSGDIKDYTKDSEYKLKATQFGFSLLGKYPLFNTGSISVFPLIGFDYALVLSAKDRESGDKWEKGDIPYKGFSPSHFSQFGLLAGAGFDFDLSGKLFIRGEALLHMRFSNKFIRELNKDADKTKATLGFGPQIKLGVGYRL